MKTYGVVDLNPEPRTLNPRNAYPLFAAAFLAAAWVPSTGAAAAGTIDRHALVTRHNVELTAPDARCPLQVGNGEFAFSADLTGLQTFPEFHAHGIPLCTEAHWAWHSVPAPAGQGRKDFQMTQWDTAGRPVPYMTSAKGQEALYAWMRENPHMLHLGRIGLELVRRDGAPATIKDVQHPRQTLDLWSGRLTSRFEFEGQPVEVHTCVHPDRDLLAVRIVAPGLGDGRVRVRVAFPYGSPGPGAADWTQPDAHRTVLTRPATNRADFARQLDADAYTASLVWSGAAELAETAKHNYTLSVARGAKDLEFVCAFSAAPGAGALPSFAATDAACAEHWRTFWSTGGAIDLSGSTDPRAAELERRIVLSQYVTALNCAGSLPPQETGLVLNSWNGKFHLEMHWWHAVHFALWDRWPLLDRSLGYYRNIVPKARELARSQGYRGLRWPKMTDPAGDDSPSGCGPLILWQQPHPIYYAELDYRLHPGKATLEKWDEVVSGTADFLASCVLPDTNTGGFAVGPPMMIVSENTKPELSRNPAFELSYWRFGLATAQRWKERLGQPCNPEWDRVLTGLDPLPVAEGRYLTMEGMTNTYTKMNWEHPGLVGPLGMLPGDGVDAPVMHATVRKVMEVWKWDRCWGWDFPMMAMAAARVGESELAVQALLIVSERKNTYLRNGFCQGGPTPYFPGNGGLLAAVAMMAAGWDGAPKTHAPGFPADGKWDVKWEGLRPMP